MTTVRVSAAVVLDDAGRALLVRKRGTHVFMQPGGKPEPGESAADALVRELAEEVGVRVPVSHVRALGTFRADAANEPGWTVVADAFAVSLDPLEIVAAGEIEEVRWVAQEDLAGLSVAPLSRDVLLPLAWG